MGVGCPCAGSAKQRSTRSGVSCQSTDPPTKAHPRQPEILTKIDVYCISRSATLEDVKANRDGACHAAYIPGQQDVIMQITAQDPGIKGFWACRSPFTILCWGSHATSMGNRAAGFSHAYHKGSSLILRQYTFRSAVCSPSTYLGMDA